MLIIYSFINKKGINNAMNLETVLSFEAVQSQNRLVKYSHGSEKTNSVKTSCYELFLLIIRGIRNQYTVSIRKKFDTFQPRSERHTPSDKYEHFVTVHIETAYKPNQESNVDFHGSQNQEHHYLKWVSSWCNG